MLTLNILNPNNNPILDDSSVPEKNCCGSCKNSGQCSGKNPTHDHHEHDHDHKTHEIIKDLFNFTNLLTEQKESR